MNEDFEVCPVGTMARLKEMQAALRAAIKEADVWFDENCSQGKCPNLDQERLLCSLKF